MPHKSGPRLSHREQQIMALLDRLGQATAAEIVEAMPEPLSNSAIRTHLRLLEVKGYVQHIQNGPRFVFLPTHPKHTAARSALRQVVQTFFGGSVEEAVSTLLSEADLEISEEELNRLSALIEQSREGGKER